MVRKECRDCENFELRKRPGAGIFASREPYCVVLGFFLQGGNWAPDCKRYTARQTTVTRGLGRG